MGKEISLSSIEEQLDEAQDLVILADLASSDSFVTIAEELDPITQAIRQEILQKQRNILKEYIAHHFDATVDDYDDQEFVKYLKNVNNCSIINQAFADSKVKADLEKAEIVGYKKVHYRFADQFHPINWQDGERQENVRAQIVKNNYGDELATIQETTHKIKETLVLSDGTSKQINSYRTIDLPTKLLNKTGPMHLSLAVRDEYGRNIAKDRAVYFTAHYDSQGKLLEISSPKPVKFNGVGDDAIGYIEHLGQIYTLPVTQGKYREMMLEVERNNGQEVNLSQISSIAQDNIITNNITTTNIDLSKQQDKKQYYQKGKKLAEEKLTQVAQHYRLAKERSEIITKELQYDYNRDNAGNRQLFEQQAANFKTVHDLTPQQAIIKYQEILDILQPKVKVRDQERKLLQQLAKQYPALAAKSVAKHFILHAAAYNQEKTEDASSKALEELEVTVEICGGYKNLGLIPITKPLPEFSKIKQQSAKMVKEADQLIAELEAADQSLQEELKKIQALADNLPESNPNKKRLNIFVKLKLEEQEAIRTGNPLSKSKERDEYLRRATADKQIDQGTKERKVAPSDYRTITERIIAKLVGRDYKSHSNKAGEKTSLICKVSPNHDTIVSPPLTPKVQLNKTPVNKR